MSLVYLTRSQQDAYVSALKSARTKTKHRSRKSKNVQEWVEAWENRGYISAKPSEPSKNNKRKKKSSSKRPVVIYVSPEKNNPKKRRSKKKSLQNTQRNRSNNLNDLLAKML